MNHLNYGSSNAKTCTLSFYVKSSLTGAFYAFSDLMRQLIVLLFWLHNRCSKQWERKTLTIAGDTSGNLDELLMVLVLFWLVNRVWYKFSHYYYRCFSSWV